MQIYSWEFVFAGQCDRLVNTDVETFIIKQDLNIMDQLETRKSMRKIVFENKEKNILKGSNSLLSRSITVFSLTLFFSKQLLKKKKTVIFYLLSIKVFLSQ